MGLFRKIKMKVLLAMAALVLATGFAFTSVTASAEGTNASTEYSTEVETETKENETEDGTHEEGEGMTWDDFLNEVQNKADEYGKSEEWTTAIENIKNAVSEKRFDGLFIVNILELIVLCVYSVYKLVKNAGTKLLIAKTDTLLKKVGELTAATNSLIDEAKAVENKEESILDAYENQKKASEYANEALKNMVDGIKFTPERKTAALRALNKANEYLDGTHTED